MYLLPTAKKLGVLFSAAQKVPDRRILVRVVVAVVIIELPQSRSLVERASNILDLDPNRDPLSVFF